MLSDKISVPAYFETSATTHNVHTKTTSTCSLLAEENWNNCNCDTNSTEKSNTDHLLLLYV